MSLVLQHVYTLTWMGRLFVTFEDANSSIIAYFVNIIIIMFYHFLSFHGITQQSNNQFFVRGTNLFVLSENKDLDPEVINAGVTNYPVYSTYSLGAAVKF